LKALSVINSIRTQTGVIYDNSMTQHTCLWDPNYPECPERLISVINRCHEMKLFERCEKLTPRLADKNEILAIHTEEHFNLLKTTSECTDNEKLEDLSSRYDAIYIHPTTFNLSLLACGSTIELVDNILDEKIQNGMGKFYFFFSFAKIGI
jgi:histone deacetylase 6